MDRESQIKAIEKTFEDNKKPIERHYSKPNVVPIEILPVYPDFKVLLQHCYMYIHNIVIMYFHPSTIFIAMEIPMCASHIRF